MPRDILSDFHLQAFILTLKKKVDKNTLLPFRKIIHHLFYMCVGNRAGIKEMSSLQYAQTSE